MKEKLKKMANEANIEKQKEEARKKHEEMMLREQQTKEDADEIFANIEKKLEEAAKKGEYSLTLYIGYGKIEAYERSLFDHLRKMCEKIGLEYEYDNTDNRDPDGCDVNWFAVKWSD